MPSITEGMDGLEDTFICGECQEKTNSLTGFLVHKVLHVETGKPGSCPLCGLAFSRQVSLREHLFRKHNIPQLKSGAGNGKRQGRPRKFQFDVEISNNELAEIKTENKFTSANLSLSDNVELASHTTHIIIDQVGNGDIVNTIMQSDSPVELKSAAATTVVVKTSDIDDLRHLVEKVDGASMPETLPVQTETQSQSLQAKNATLQNYSDTLYVPHKSEVQEKGSATPGSQDVLTNVCSKNSLFSSSTSQTQLDSQSPKVKATVALSLSEDCDPDFFFVLLTSHVKRNSFHYGKQSLKCFHCEFRTSWRRALVKHMREDHNDSLTMHQCIVVHSSEKLRDQQIMKMSEYTDAVARQRRKINSQRVRGVEKQDLPGHYPCNKCDKEFGRLRYLRKHQVIHKAEKRFLCDDCGKAFKTKAYLAAHRNTHQSKMYRCSQCDFTSSINVLIHSHRQLHNDDSVICEVCGTAYNDRATLKKHKQVHDKSRPHPCAYPGCTWRFKTEVMCRAHFRGHTTSGRFMCHLCSYVFRHKHHLQRHLAKIHSMDEASVQHKTSGNRNLLPVKNVTAEVCESKEIQVVPDDEQPLADTVNLIVNSGLSSEQLQSVLESGQFVISTEENDSTINYEVENITMNVIYNTLTESAEVVPEGQTILIPHDVGCSHIIFEQETEAVPASVET